MARRRVQSATSEGLSDDERRRLRELWLSVPVDAIAEAGRDEHPALSKLRGWVDRRSNEASDVGDHDLAADLVMLYYALLGVTNEDADVLVGELVDR